MIKKLIPTIFALILFLLTFSFWQKSKPAPQPSPSPPPKKITIAMGFIPNIQFAPFYVAQHKGYFKEQNLEVTFDYGFETDLIALLADNKLQFVIGSGDQVILARQKNLPVTYIANWYRRFPVCLVSLKSSNIYSPQDLIGKKIGTPAVFGASYVGLKAILAKELISEKRVKIETIGYTQAESLIIKKVDVAICYAMNEPVELENQGQNLTIFYVADYINFVSNGLITNEKTIKENPHLIKSVINAFILGLKDTINNPDEAFEISRQFIPTLSSEKENVQKKVLLESIKFWQSDQPGLSSKEDWQKSVDFMQQAGLIDSKPELDKLFTNQFVE
jgi:NitT/TauT family transport system substrate-binding protein